MNARAPNVLFVVVDEWRAQAFGYAGDPNAHTPAIDALAAESVDFAEAVAGHPVCCPSRASFLTGQYPLDHGVFVNDVELVPTGPTIAEAFAGAGYDTGYIGKWHLYGSPDGWFGRRNAFVPPEARHGFRHWEAAECTHDYNHSVYYAGDDPTPRVWGGYDAFAQTDAAVDFMMKSDRDAPFFLMLSYGPPHFPLESAPETYREMYRSREIVLRDNVPEDLRAEAIRDLRGYYAHMAAIDECVARLLAGLEAGGLADETILVFTADHGDMMWSQGLEYKLVPWEESIRVPLLVRAPGTAPVRRMSTINSPDLMPTILGYAGVPVPDGLQGSDFSVDDPGPETAFLNVPASFSTLRWYGIAEYRGVRDTRYTYVRSLRGPWLLYDNRADPFQRRNLVDDPVLAEVRDRLDRELDAWLGRLGDEFLPSELYLERDGLTHYFEVNEPLGFAEEAHREWASTLDRGRGWSIDTPVALILEEPAAHVAVERIAAGLLDTIVERELVRDSIRVAAMLNVGLVADGKLIELDGALGALGRRVNSGTRDRVSEDRISFTRSRSPEPWRESSTTRN